MLPVVWRIVHSSSVQLAGSLQAIGAVYDEDVLFFESVLGLVSSLVAGA